MISMMPWSGELNHVLLLVVVVVVVAYALDNGAEITHQYVSSAPSVVAATGIEASPSFRAEQTDWTRKL